MTTPRIANNDGCDKRSSDARSAADEQTFETLNKLAPVGVFEADRDGNCTFANPAIQDLLECRPEELFGAGWANFLHPDDRDRVVAAWQKTVAGEAEFNTEFRFVPKSGNVMWFAGGAAARRDGSREITGFVGTLVDVTERYQAGEALAASEQKFRAVFDQAMNSIVMIDTFTMRFIDFNAAAHERLGYTREEFAQLTLFDIEAQETPEEVRTHAESIRRAGPQTFETRHRAKDGHILNMLVNVRPLSLGDKRLLVGIWTDITARRQAEDALRESEHKFKTLFERAVEPHVIYGPAGYVECNQAALDVLGLDSSEQLIGRHPADVSPPVQPDGRDSRETADELLAKARREGSLRFEWVCRRADGSEVLLDILLNAITIGGKPAMHSVWRDVTEQRRATEELRRIAWLLVPRETDRSSASAPYKPVYGDLTALNTAEDGILATLGRETLETIASDYLDLLETSAAIYEANGDYALGIFTSGWCRFLDQASHRQCGPCDTREALACGRWACHESCWHASRRCMEEGRPVDVECAGGLRLYSVPIRAGQEVIGSMNFGYGDPPRDTQTLRRIAEQYGIEPSELNKEAALYRSRPAFLVDVAKRRLETAASLIGAMVETKRAEAEVRLHKERLEELVQQRTAQLVERNTALARTLANLESAQSQILQSEKMAVLGRLAASVAHEVNNPLSAITSTSRLMTDAAGRFVDQVADFTDILCGEDADLVKRGIQTATTVSHAPLSSRKRRELRGMLVPSLAAVGVDSANAVADLLVDLNLHENYADYLPLLRRDDNLRVLQRIRDLCWVSRGTRLIQIAADRAAKIILALNSYARQKDQTAWELVDVRETIETVLLLYHNRMKENVELATRFDDAPPIECIHDEVCQVWTNLIHNALQAMDFAGELTVSLAYDDHRVTVTIGDTGCGIPDDLRDRIFDPFVTSKEKGEGCGLGLDIVRNIVFRHHGEIRFESEVGRGTTFTVSLPFRQPPSPHREGTACPIVE